MKSLKVIAGGKSSSKIRRVDVHAPASKSADKEVQKSDTSDIERFIKDVLTPLLVDMQRDVQEMHNKYNTLLRLLADKKKRE